MSRKSSRRFAVISFTAILFPFLSLAGRLQGSTTPAGHKDGINLYIRFSNPLNPKNPIIICELENTLDTPVSFQLQGAAEGLGLELHLIDESGKEIEKTNEWKRLYETGDSMHTRYGVISPNRNRGPVEIELEKAYGRKWTNGARLDIEWNSKELRTGPGPGGGQFGIGSGLMGSLDITPLTGKKFTPRSESQKPESMKNPLEDKFSSHNDKSEPVLGISEGNTNTISTNSTFPANRPDSEIKIGSKVWILVVIVFLVAVGLSLSTWIARRRS